MMSLRPGLLATAALLALSAGGAAACEMPERMTPELAAKAEAVAIARILAIAPTEGAVEAMDMAVGMPITGTLLTVETEAVLKGEVPGTLAVLWRDRPAYLEDTGVRPGARVILPLMPPGSPCLASLCGGSAPRLAAVTGPDGKGVAELPNGICMYDPGLMLHDDATEQATRDEIARRGADR